MLDRKFIEPLQAFLESTRASQKALFERLNEAEATVKELKAEIIRLDSVAKETEARIDKLLSGGRNPIVVVDGDKNVASPNFGGENLGIPTINKDNTVSFFRRPRSIPSIVTDNEPLTSRFADRTITQACTLLLSESGRPLHVNELYNALVAGGMKFNGKNPTISIAVSLNRNDRFSKVGPGTFDLSAHEDRRSVSI